MKFSTWGQTRAEEAVASGGTPAMTPDFSVYTGAMEIDSEHEYVVHMVGSSTERDLQGDTMSISALTDMTAVPPGQSTWLNHRYELPDSLFGSLTKSPSLTLEAGIADIHIVSDVENSNPAALQTYGYIKKGRRLGCSIGCLVTEFEVDEENDDGHGWWPPIIILHVLVLEFSVVGIPASQRCWVEPATKGLFGRMLSEGKGDQALKLAPAVKGLYPHDFQERLKSIDNKALRRDLERIEVRVAPTGRVEWVPNEHTFVMNQKGVYSPVERREVSTLLTKGVELPSYYGFAEERTAGTAIPPVITKSLPDDENALWSEKGASGKTTWPLADEDVSWDVSSAREHIKEYAGGDDDIDWSKVHSCCFWFDPESPDTWDGCKLFFVDKNDGSMKAIPHGIYACAASVQGARAELKIPEEDVPAVKKKIETYYHKMDKKAPWEEDDGKAIAPEKRDAITPMRHAGEDVPAAVLASIQQAEERYDEEHEFVLSSGPVLVPCATASLDVQLYNALALKFGQSQLALTETGQIIKSVPTLSADTLQEILTKALSLIKSGNEFSKENREALQSLHDGLVNMCMSSFHPCREMEKSGNDANDPDHDGDSAYDPDGDGDGAAKSIERLLIRSLSPLQEQVTLLVSALSQHALDPATLKSMQTRVQSLQRQFQAVEGQIKASREQVAKLQNMPIGQPTRINRSLYQDPVSVSHEDLLHLARTKGLPMNDNERAWTLEEALKATVIVVRSLPDGESLNCRKWPEGVGGSVQAGVRPELTGAQRAWMHPMEMIAYNDGGEAAVPCYDDPGGILP